MQWRDGDRWTAHLREEFASLAADESLSDKGRHDAAERYLQTAAPRIQRGYEKAAALLEREARRKALASVPLPGGNDLTFKVKDSSDLIAVQNEAQSIIARIERWRARMPKNIKNPTDNTVDVLKNEYAAALSAEGVEAMTKARGVLKACEELGVDQGEVVAPFMEESHREAADEARRLEYLRQQVPNPKAMIPTNPFALESKPRGEYHTRRGGNLFAPRTTTTDQPGARSTGRRRPWK